MVEKGNYKIIEAGQTNESGTLYRGFIVKNGENSNVIKNFKFRITFRNKKGEIIGSSEDEAYLKADAGQDIPLSSSVDIEGKPDKIEYEIMDVEKIDEEFKSLKDINVMKPIGLKIRGLKEDNYSRMLTGELDNESATSYDSVKVYLIFRDKNGRIVGGCVEDSESVKKKSKSPISISLYRKFVTKDFEVYAIGDK